MSKLLAALLVSVIALVAAGCNTIEGAGKDVKAAGGAVEKAAAKSKPY
jgi:entericidin B